MANLGNKGERSRMNSRLTRRQVIKAGGVAALGLAFSRPIVDTLRPKPVSANVSFDAGGGINPSVNATPFAITLPANRSARIRRETPDPNTPPTPPFADQVLSLSTLAMIVDFDDGIVGGDRVNRTGRSVLHFDISPIVPGSIISSALLTMVCSVGLADASLISAHNILPPSSPATYSGPFPSWSASTLRWNNQLPPDGTGGFSPSLDHETTVQAWGVSAPAGTSFSILGDLTFDLTLLVQDWVSGARLNNGVLMKAGDESTEVGVFCWPPGSPVSPRLIVSGSTGGSDE